MENRHDEGQESGKDNFHVIPSYIFSFISELYYYIDYLNI